MIGTRAGTATQYQNKINTIIGNVTDANDLVSQIQEFDAELQSSRLIQYLTDFTKQVMTTEKEYQLIRDAIGHLKQ